VTARTVGLSSYGGIQKPGSTYGRSGNLAETTLAVAEIRSASSSIAAVDLSCLFTKYYLGTDNGRTDDRWTDGVRIWPLRRVNNKGIYVQSVSTYVYVSVYCV